jgi:hypothetical protein
MMRLTKILVISAVVMALGISVPAVAGKGPGGGGSGGGGGMSGMGGTDAPKSMSMEQHRNRVQTGNAEQKGELVRERNEDMMRDTDRSPGGGKKGK